MFVFLFDLSSSLSEFEFSFFVSRLFPVGHVFVVEMVLVMDKDQTFLGFFFLNIQFRFWEHESIRIINNGY